MKKLNMMKMYKQPNTEVVNLKGSDLMQVSLVVSTGTPDDPAAPPVVNAPGHRGFYE